MPDGTVVATYGGFDLDHPEAGGALRAAGLELVSSPRDADRTPDQLVDVVGEAVAVMADADPFDASVFPRLPNLKIVARTGVGLDSVDLEAATANGVVVTITPGTNNETVADHALTLMLAASRRLGINDRLVREGGWRSFDVPLGQLHGKTVGLIGHGAIGGAVGRRVLGFGAELLVCDPAGDAGGGRLVELDELLELADVISVHAPLTPQTHHVLNAETLARTKPGVVIVNTSRGPLIDEAALIDALRSGHVGAAGIDVFEVEPPGRGGLGEFPNVILSPHCAGISAESNLAMSRMATESVLSTLAGRPSGTIANPGVLDRLR